MVPPFAQLIDLGIVRPLMQSFAATSGLPLALIDRDGKVLTTSGWQKICTYFHRRHPLPLQRCIESDTDFSGLPTGGTPACGDHFESLCRNGLVHIGFPILIGREHLATLFLSQFFYAPPDLDFFRRQANEFGFAEEPYLEAVRRVPVIERSRVEQILGFYAGFARLLAKLGTEHLQRLESRRQLEESERKFRSIFDSALDSIVLVASDGRLLEANEQAMISLGYERQELLALTKFDIHLPDERSRVAGYLEKIMQVGSDRLETIQRRRDGTLFPVEISGRRVEFLGAPAILCLTRDISVRKEGEAALRKALTQAQESREKIDAILRAVPDGLVVTDLLGRIVLMNPQAERLLQLSPPHLAPLTEAVAEKELRQRILAARDQGQEQESYEWEVKTGNGPAVLQARSMPVRTEGRLTGTITLLRDITREREIDRMKDDFIATAAHELRTPLTTIMGFVELLLRHDADTFSAEERREFLETVYQRAETLEKIILDLLDLSRVRSGLLIRLQKAPVDLTALLRETVGIYQEMARNHRFVLELPAAPVHRSVDAGKIRQLLENLLSNAVKFSPTGGIITVRGDFTDGDFQVTVADQGIGMSPEQVARVFDKFYRADASTTAASGLGLGMNIVKSIVEAHGGQIWMESRPGEGTQAHFTLPAEEE